MVAKHAMSVVSSSFELELPARRRCICNAAAAAAVFLYIRVCKIQFLEEIPKSAGFSCFTLKIPTNKDRNYQTSR